MDMVTLGEFFEEIIGDIKDEHDIHESQQSFLSDHPKTRCLLDQSRRFLCKEVQGCPLLNTISKVTDYALL